MIYYTHRLLFICLLLVFGLSVTSAQCRRFTLQVEAMDDSCSARELVHELKSSGVDAYYVKTHVPGKGTFYRVRVGNFLDQTAAARKGEQLLRARLIKEYYVTRYEGVTYEAGPVGEIHQVSDPVPISYTACSKNESVSAPIVTPVVVSHPPAYQQRSLPVVKVYSPSPIYTSSNLASEVVSLGPGFNIANGSVVTAVTSVGVVTRNDKPEGAVIPYQGLEAPLKFTAGISHNWTLPVGTVAADLLIMEVNREAGIRQFYTASVPIHQFRIASGRTIVPELEAGEYMIRLRLNTGQLIFQPLSVRGAERTTVQTN